MDSSNDVSPSTSFDRAQALHLDCRLLPPADAPGTQLSSSGYWGTTTLSGSRSWSRNSRSCCSRASNGRDLALTCVLCPRLEELVSLNFRGMELRSRRRIGLRSELQLSYNIQTGETTEVELRFIYADRTE